MISNCEEPLVNECFCSGRADILIVDDNVFNIVTLKHIIESKTEAIIDTATNGKEALDKVKERFVSN